MWVLRTWKEGRAGGESEDQAENEGRDTNDCDSREAVGLRLQEQIFLDSGVFDLDDFGQSLGLDIGEVGH